MKSEKEYIKYSFTASSSGCKNGLRWCFSSFSLQNNECLNDVRYSVSIEVIDQFVGGFTSSGKERDEETGYGYFGARYYDADILTGWLSVDPMADKYPGISPYAYCAWNPVKLVDENGKEFGDFYNTNGTYLGWDGKLDYNVYIIDNGTLLTKDANGYIDPGEANPIVSTTYQTFNAMLGVYERTKNNGGIREESTAILADYLSIEGESGYVCKDGKHHCDFPYLTNIQRMLGVTSIHSHLFAIEGEAGYHSTDPSKDDLLLFNMCNMNIIIGYISTPTDVHHSLRNEDNIGAVFYNSDGSKITSMSIRSIEKIVSNRQNVIEKHYKQILK